MIGWWRTMDDKGYRTVVIRCEKCGKLDEDDGPFTGVHHRNVFSTYFFHSLINQTLISNSYLSITVCLDGQKW